MLFKLLLSIILYTTIISQECPMKKHKFYLLPIPKIENENENVTNITDVTNNTINNQKNLTGLYQNDYILILETDPLGDDKYEMILKVSFPININIELSTDIIYTFESKKRFCVTDLIVKESKGKLNNILGKLSEYNTENQILENVWVKVEDILYNETVGNEIGNKNNFYLLTGFKESNQKNKYILKKKMNSKSEYFQIVRAKITEKDLYESENNTLTIGTVFTVKSLNDQDSDDTPVLRDKINYDGFTSVGTTQKNYNLEEIENFICLVYDMKTYTEKCFSRLTKDDE